MGRDRARRALPALPPELAKSLTWVAPGVALVEPTPGHAGASSMLIEDGDVLLVDAGLAPEQRARLAPFVDVCILTHAHPKHVSGAHDFREVWAPRAEADGLKSPENFCEAHNVARRDRPLVMEALAKWGFTPLPDVKEYRPNGILKLDTFEWRFLHAPGHSPGLTLLLDPKRHILFASDMDGSDHGPWYGWPSSDPDELERSAEELARVDVAILLTSHTPPRRRGIRQMFRGMASRIQERDRRVLHAVNEPKTLDELVSLAPVSGRALRAPIEHYFERVMTEKHLLRLLEKDYIGARQDGRYERVD